MFQKMYKKLMPIDSTLFKVFLNKKAINMITYVKKMNQETIETGSK